MVSASALINTILTQMQEYVKEGALKDVQLILYMNLADYSFSRNEVTKSLRLPSFASRWRMRI